MNKEGSLFQGSGSTDTAAEYKEPVFRLGAPSSVSEIISFQLSSFQRQPLSFGKWPAIKWFPELAVYLSGEKKKKIHKTNKRNEKYKMNSWPGRSEHDSSLPTPTDGSCDDARPKQRRGHPRHFLRQKRKP